MTGFLKSIRGQLFLFYSGFIAVLIFVLGLSFFLYTSALLTQRATDTMIQLSGSISSQLDAAVKVVDETSIRVAYSKLVMETFLRYQANRRILTVPSQIALRDIFIAIMGPLQSVYQINLYDFHGTVVGAGATSTISTVDLLAVSWYRATLERAGAKYITPPYQIETRAPQRRFLSLNRVYYDTTNVPIGIIEVQQEYARIFDSAASTVQKLAPWIRNSRLFVFDASGRVVFPFEGSTTPAYRRYFDAIGKGGTEATFTALNGIGGREIVAFAASDYTGWSVVFAASEASLLGPLYRFSRIMVAACLGFILVSALISFLLARRLTLPIGKIHGAIESLSIREFPDLGVPALRSGFNELESLYMSFRDMCARLDRSITELLASKSHEANARMLALQSQMNPHFLSNTVTIISIMAEERMSDEIIKVCDDLLFMLRYISSNTPLSVTILQEIEHTQCYLNLMKHRYGEKVSYRIDIPPDMRDVPVPKLVIQPLVENALKYGIHVQPPWTIRIDGSRRDGQWTVRVRDNGSGFSPEALGRLDEGMNAVLSQQSPPNTPLEGMGLLNIFARLRLLYADKARFKATNLNGGGAEVEIGGSL